MTWEGPMASPEAFHPPADEPYTTSRPSLGKAILVNDSQKA